MKKTVITLCAFAITAAFGLSNEDYDKFIALDDSGKYKEALAFIKPRADSGDARAVALVGYLYEVRMSNIGEGVKWYKKAMGLNDSLAHSNMARIYYRMTDYKLAAQTFEKASKLGDTGADAMLGNMYLNGIHFKKDYKKALIYIQKAVADDDPHALTDLAICYENSYGVARDMDKAIEFYKRGAAGGNEYAKRALERLQ
ncbi:sel1 repeat family protein [Campylobacter sp. Marseille-Q3452]|uniref:beta-lactamase n=1 Tax=Campylobacter massiliensis TaxID=2762557 RepID=A0A842JB78_9BACT|nr:tetratricopeptide repeat protein [Campylobacter massiliensis]MBC2882703.1 sel1 repeat family protein [Campylobacter massiliensis]